MSGTTLSISSLNALLKSLHHDETIPHIQDALVLSNILDLYKSFICKNLAQANGLSPEAIFHSLDRPQTLDQGDLVLPIPRLRVKGANTSELGNEWARKFPTSILLDAPKLSGSHLQFNFSPRLLPQICIPYIFDRDQEYGRTMLHTLSASSDSGNERKKVVVEFSSPNIAKQFHAGHLRSTIIGGFLSNLYECAGWEVIRMNYLGDWGRQYGMLAIGWERFGSEELLAANPMGHLVDVYVKINALVEPEELACKLAAKQGKDTSEMESSGWLGQVKAYFKKLEDGDPAAVALWRRFRKISIERYKATYARLNIRFDEYSGESKVKPETMREAEAMLAAKGISEKNQGATIIDFKKHGAPSLDVAIIRNRNGTSNYLLRDIGAAIERWEMYHFDKMIYVIMCEQDLHLKRLFKTLELLGYTELSSRVQHVSFGKVQGMSTRKGNVKYLDDILEESGAVMHEVMQKNEAKYSQLENPTHTSDILGITAVMVQDMAGKRIHGYKYDSARMTSFEGDTGPYLQYAHARLCSVARKAGLGKEQLLDADFSLLKEDHAVNLVRVLAQYPDIIEATFKSLEPTTVLTYLFKLTHQLSSGYDTLRVVNAPEGPATTAARAALYESCRIVLRNGMKLLGLMPLERM